MFACCDEWLSLSGLDDEILQVWDVKAGEYVRAVPPRPH